MKVKNTKKDKRIIKQRNSQQGYTCRSPLSAQDRQIEGETLCIGVVETDQIRPVSTI